MAAVTSQPAAFASSGSSHGGRGVWDYSVPPMEDDKTAYSDQKPYMSEAAAKSTSRQPFPNLVNGTSKPATRKNTLDSQTSNKSLNQEPSHAVPQRVNQLSRKTSNLSSPGSDSDSLLDLYKQHVDNRNGTNLMPNGEKRKVNTVDNWLESDMDESNWIHRDKLAQIESKELEEAGFRVRRMSRSSSTGTRDRSVNRDEKRQRMISPIPAEDEAEENERQNWDLRTPEEAAAEQADPNNRNQSGRPSVSRIPLAKASPLPVPNQVVERDSPLPRSRQGSVGWNEQGIAFPKGRSRSTSVGSQVLLDDAGAEDPPLPPERMEPTPTVTSPKGSPSKAKTPSKTTPTSAKKATRGNSQSKSRSGSGENKNKRPGTSGGARPSTSHRPEGEAPWIATMYKPDPSLPPDQQIIPTHAKRMAQEQWEREGKTGSMYDREFRLLNTEEFRKPTPSPKLKIEDPEKDELLPSPNKEWPLPLPSPRSDRSGAEHGGYTTMPTISSPKIPQTPGSPVISPPNPPRPEDVIRIEDPPEPRKEEEKKKLCCCIIM